MSAIALDPLIAEAKRRTLRRRFALVAAVVVVAAAAGTTLETRSSGNSLGICATAPPGWKERSFARTPTREATVVLTNWRFGPAADFYGLFLPPPWPRSGVTVVVSNDGPDATPRFRSALRVSREEFTGFEGMRFPAAQTAIRRGGRVIAAYVEVGSVNPATIAAANRALAGAGVCSA